MKLTKLANVSCVPHILAPGCMIMQPKHAGWLHGCDILYTAQGSELHNLKFPHRTTTDVPTHSLSHIPDIQVSPYEQNVSGIALERDMEYDVVALLVAPL